MRLVLLAVLHGVPHAILQQCIMETEETSLEISQACAYCCMRVMRNALNLHKKIPQKKTGRMCLFVK
jgi:hypothetical protein